MQGQRTVIVLSLFVALVVAGALLLFSGGGPEAGGNYGAAGTAVGPTLAPPDPVAVAGPSTTGPVDRGRGGITGRVLLFEGRTPVRDAVVRISGGPDDFEPVSVVTDEEGRFHAMELPAASGYVLDLKHGEFAAVRRLDLTVAKDADLDVGSLYLERAVVLTVQVVDGAGAGVPGASISVFPSAGPGSRRGSPSAWFESILAAADVPTPLRTKAAGPDGVAEIGDLPAGFYQVAASAEGFGRGGGERLLTPDSENDPLVVRIGRGFSLSGTVVDGENGPVAGTLVLTPSTAGLQWGVAPLRVAAPVGEDGRYQVDGIGPGVWNLLFVRDGRPPWPGGTIDVPSITQYDLDVSGAGVVLGVVAEPGGTPVPGARIRVAVSSRRGGQNFGATTISGEDGTYRIEALPEGNLFAVEVTKEGYAAYPPPGSQRDNIPVSRDSPTRFDVELARGVAVTGAVTVAPDGAPVVGATVTAIPRGAWGAMSWPTAVTGDDGRYELPALAAGEYGLRVDAENCCQPGLPQPWAIQNGWQSVEDKWVVRVVGAGPIVKDLVLERGARVTGRVEDSEGRPVSGASVWLSVEWNGEPAVTGGDGVFEFNGVPPAEQAVAQGRTTAQWGRSDPFRLTVGGHAQGLLIRLQAAGRIEGKVEISDGSKPVGGLVRAVQGDPSRQPWLLAQRGANESPVADDGTFMIENVPPGMISVIAEVPGYPPGFSSATNLPAGATRTNVWIRLETGRAIHGVVLNEKLEPVAGAEINAWRNDRPWRQAQATIAQTGPDGKFEIRGLEQGVYSVRALKDGLTPATEGAVEAGPSANVRLVLAAGRDVAGQVLDSNGRPVGGILVSVQAKGGDSPLSSRAMTGPDGTFRITGVPEGLYVVRAAPPTGSRLNYSPGVAEDVAAGAENVTIRLEVGYRISGRIVEENGQPAAGLQVWANPSQPVGPEQGKMAQTDAEGYFEITGLRDAEYSIGVAQRGETAPLYMPGVPAGTESLSLVLSPPLRIEGRVVGPDGLPVSGVQVSAQPMPGTSGSSNSSGTNRDGRFALNRLARGSYRLTITAPGRFVTRILDDVPSGSSGIGVVMEEGVVAKGVVLDQAGQPAPRVYVQARPIGGGTTSGARANDKGAFEIKGLDGGAYEIVVYNHPQGLIAHPAPRFEGAAENLVVKLAPGFSIGGRIVDGNGRGVQQAWVSVSGQNWSQTDAAGQFRVTGLSPGDHQLMIWANGRQINETARAGDVSVEIRLD